MPPLLQINSFANPRVKTLIKLGKGRGKDRKEHFIFEGLKEVELALDSGIHIESVYICSDIASKAGIDFISARVAPENIFKITPEIFARIAYRDSTGGILVLAKTKYISLQDLNLSACPLILVLESVEKPGNLGGILRTADAAGLDAVILCDPLTDLYNPNIIRNSLGTIFTMPTVACTSDEAMNWLRQKGIRIFATDLQATGWYHSQDYTGPSAFIMGTEAKGLSGKWLEFADLRIKIPMAGKIDSMNVSTSAAVLVFEAVRQRS